MEIMTVTRKDYERAPKLEAALKDLKIPMEKRDICLHGTKTKLDRFQAVVRTDTHDVLSVVSPGYALFGHEEAMRAPTKHLLDQGWEVVRAVTERNGAHAHLELVDKRVSLIPEEQIYPRLTCTNTVDLRGSLKFRMGIYRLVCKNGLMIADPRFKMGLALRQVHMGDVDSLLKKLTSELTHKVEDVLKYIGSYRGLMNQVVDVETAEKTLRKVVGKRQLERVMYLWEHAEGQPKPYNTAWGLYNGLTSWLTHEAKGGVYQRDLKSQMALRQIMALVK